MLEFGLNICFNTVGDHARLGTPLIELPFADFVKPITQLVTAQFTIATMAVARHMIRRNAGVILTMTGSGVPTADMGGAMTAWAAVDALCGQPARELGPHGIRVLWLRFAIRPVGAGPHPRSPPVGRGRHDPRHAKLT